VRVSIPFWLSRVTVDLLAARDFTLAPFAFYAALRNGSSSGSFSGSGFFFGTAGGSSGR
jgi:hypothetical protein